MDLSRRKLTAIVAFISLITTFVILSDMIPVKRKRDYVNLPTNVTHAISYLNIGDRPDDGRCILKDGNNAERNSVDLRVIILTYNRATSLLRLLWSLEQAYYQNDRVVIEIWLDRSKSHEVHIETLQAALRSNFNSGKCHVYVHPVHVGIVGQWLTTWRPAPNTSEIGVILEDDLTVSPYVYKYLKTVHRKYRNRPDIYGFSLQGKSLRHSDGNCCIEVPLKNKVFLYPTLGTSGFSPCNRHWLQFLSWYKEIVTKNVSIPLIENHVTAEWYKEFQKMGKADTIWEMEYLYYTRKRKQFSLYPNFPGHRGLTFNWYEDGLHFKGLEHKSRDEEHKNLVTSWNFGFDDFPDYPVRLNDSGAIVK